jgi:hypothetical protein
MLQKTKIIFFLILFHIPIDAEIEEIITTGSLIENSEIDSSPISLISADDYKNFNISSIAEVSTSPLRLVLTFSQIPLMELIKEWQQLL